MSDQVGNPEDRYSRDRAHFFQQVSHKKHRFAFGNVVNDGQFLDPAYVGYQNLFYEFFNWATVQSYKWKYNQGNRVRYEIKLIILSKITSSSCAVQ